MYLFVINYDSNCSFGSISVADNFSTCTFAVPTLICGSLVFGGPCGFYGAM